jgi:ADP-heptose:LPS heptosyltransferase
MLIKMNGGIGDMLLLTIIFRKIFEETGSRLSVVSNFKDIFLFNDSVKKVYSEDNLWTRFRDFFGTGYYEITYRCWSHLLPDKKTIFNTHAVEQFCHQLKIQGSVSLKPEIFFSNEEVNSFSKTSSDYIVVQSQASHSNHPQTTKDWSVESMQEVVDCFGKNFEILQLGSEKDVRLKGVSDFCGKISIREAGLFLKNARLFVGLEGALMHMARAVDCPSVIVWGGRLKPHQIGYPCFENVTADLECSPCWLPNTCPHDLACMKEIKSTQVIEACKKIISHKDIELPIDKIEIVESISPKQMKNEIADFPPHLDHLIKWN